MTVVYRRFGGSTHVRIDTFAELKEAVSIPETQWVATSAPLSSFVADQRFLDLLDADGNKRLRVDELQAAVHWMATMFEREGGVDSRAAMLTLSDLTPAAEPLKAAAVAVLDVVNATDKNSITLTQIREAEAPLRAAGRNGDGIVAPEHLPASLRALATTVMKTADETKNRADKAGLAPATLAAFRTERDALLAHLQKKAEIFSAVAVTGMDSLAWARRVDAVAARLDEHFLLCRLVASQPDARERFRLAADRIEALVGNRAAMEVALAALPIAPPDPSGVLSWSTLHRGPSYEQLLAFAKEVAGPVVGQSEYLSEQQWRDLHKKAAAILEWQATFDKSPVAAADVAAIDDKDLDALKAAQDKDLEDKKHLDAIADLEKLVLFQRFILDIANSFLAMPDLYTNHRAMYERGWAVLAGRRYELSLLVPDLAAHKTHTEKGTTCVVYGKVQDKDGGVTFEVVMPKTRGWSNELSVGKRGVFYDLDNKEYDIVVTHLVRQPVSVMEAALTPFLRIGEFLNEKLESMNAGVDDAVKKQSAALGKQIDATKAAVIPGTAAATPPASPAPAPATPTPAPAAAAPANPAMGNALAMGGLAVAAVGSSVAFIAAQLKALSVGDLISIVMLGFLAIAAPSGFVGWLKLRKRNLAQLLEGAGWALNDRLRVTKNLAARITQTPSRVKGSRLEIMQTPPAPGEQEDSDWAWKLGLVVAVVFVVLWQFRFPLMRVGCHEGSIPEAVCVAAGIPDINGTVVPVAALPGSPAATAAPATVTPPATPK